MGEAGLTVRFGQRNNRKRKKEEGARKGGREGAYLYEVGEVAGAVFDHQTVNDSFEVGLAVVVGEEVSEKENIQCLERE